MASLPTEVQSMFLEGQHTVRHVCGASISTWSDMFTESTFIWYEHSDNTDVFCTLGTFLQNTEHYQ